MSQLMKVPIILWNDQPPSHQITCISVCKNGVIVTGSVEGQLITWTVHETNNILTIKAQSMIIAHASSVESVVGVHSTKLEISSSVISLASNQEICLWNAETSCCLATTYLRGRYHSLWELPSRFTNSIQDCLVACFGHQDSILIIDSFSLSAVFVLKQDFLQFATSSIRSACVTSFCEEKVDEIFLSLTHNSTLISWKVPSIIDYNKDMSPTIIPPKYIRLSPHINKSYVRYISIEPARYINIALASVDTLFILRLLDLLPLATFTFKDDSINDVIYVSETIIVLFFLNIKPIILILTHDTFQIIKSVPMFFNSAHVLLDNPAILRRESSCMSFLFAATASGSVLLWRIPTRDILTLDELNTSCETSIDEIWRGIQPAGISTSLTKSLSLENGCVSCSHQLQEYGFMIFGLKDGSIAIANTLELLVSRMLDGNESNISSVILKGHEGPVTCLCHPFEECTKHNPCHLLSGGADFSVRLWNIVTGTQLKVYYPHGGIVHEIFALNGEFIDSTALTVISIASDYSVSLINLAREKEVLTTRCHTSPVYAVKWRLLEDILLVYCTDGNLFIWHISTGNLERCVSGKSAIEIFDCLNEKDEEDNEERPASPNSRNVVVNMYQSDQPTRSHSVLRDIKTKRGFMGSYPHNAHDMSSKTKVFQKVMTRISIVKHRNRNMPPFVIKDKDVGENVQSPGHSSGNVSAIPSHHSSANNLAQQAPNVPVSTETTNTTTPVYNSTVVPPFDVIPVRTGHHDSDFHVFLIDVDVLVSQLLNEEEYQYLKENISRMNLASKKNASTTSSNPSVGPSIQSDMSLPTIMSHQQNLAMLILTLGLCPTTDSRAYLKYCKSIQNYHSTLLLNTARLLISILHPWGLDAAVDKICLDHLELRPANNTISFGYMSHNKIQLNMPGWTRSNLFFIPTPSIPDHVDLYDKYVLHWQVSSAMTSQHMVVLSVLINTFLKLNSYNSDLNMFSVCGTIRSCESQSKIITTRGSLSGRQFITASVPDLTKRSCLTVIDNKVTYWKSLFKYYIYISDHMKYNRFYQYPLFHELILYWLDYYDEVRRATYNLLITELNRISPAARISLVSSWTVYLPSNDEIEHTNIEDLLILSMDDYVDSGGYYGFWPSNKRYQRTISVFLISFIISEFSNEFDPLIVCKNKPCVLSMSQIINLAMIMTKIIKMNINLKRFTYYHVKKAILFLLGRSFSLWQPHLNLSQVISCILDNIAILRYHLQHLEIGNQEKSPKYSVCNNMILAHRNCLQDILFSHPHVFLHLLNKEMTRYSTTGSHILGVGHFVFVAPSAHNDVGHFHNPLTSQPNIFNLVRVEITYLIDLFATKHPDKFTILMIEAVDLLINCSAYRIVKKETDLMSTFPFLSRFHIVDYCQLTHRLIVGGQRGQLGVYDIRSIRCCFTAVFKSPVTCIKFGPDGKHLVAFSYDEMNVNVLNAQTHLLGISSQSFRVEVSFPVKTNIIVSPQHLYQIQIVWKTFNSFKIVFPQNQELSFTI